MSGIGGGSGGGGKKGGGREGNTFGGGDYIRDQFPDNYEEYLAKKAGKEGNVGGKLVTYDNEIGEVTLRLPPQHAQHSAEVLEELYEQFFGAAAGDPKVQEEMNLFVAEWPKSKEGGVESQSL